MLYCYNTPISELKENQNNAKLNRHVLSPSVGIFLQINQKYKIKHRAHYINKLGFASADYLLTDNTASFSNF